jgi:hypothetical protein
MAEEFNPQFPQSPESQPSADFAAAPPTQFAPPSSQFAPSSSQFEPPSSPFASLSPGFSQGSPEFSESPSGDENHGPPRGEMGHPGALCDIADELGIKDIQMRAIELIVRGMPQMQIARLLALDRKTLWRWKTFDPHYQYALYEARHEISAMATDRYQNLLVRATGVLGKFMDDPAEDKRYRAAQTVLNMAGNFRKSVESKVIERPKIPMPDLPYKMG